MSESLDERRAVASRLYDAGDPAAAARRQASVVVDPGATRADVFRQVLYLDSARDHDGVRRALEAGLARWPGDRDLEHSLAAALVRAGDFDAAVPRLQAALVHDPDSINLNDGLAHALAETGDLEGARRHGECALLAKDARARATDGILLRPREAPGTSAPGRNVIAYSLWGGNFRYLDTARRNAELARVLFPEWTCRIYLDDTVPDFVRGQLLAEGAELVLMPRPRRLFEGLFWRFLPAGDPGLDRFLCRDADSLLSLRERDAVEAWMASRRSFHVMRDDFAHTDLILAGMWGGVSGRLPPLEPLWQTHLARPHRAANIDQRFLGEVVWPLIRDDVLIHDRCYRCLDSRPFPGRVPAGDAHVGANEVLMRPPTVGRLRSEQGAPTLAPRSRYVFTLTSGRSGTAYLTELLRSNLDAAEVHHERTSPAYAFGWHTPDASHFTRFNTLGNVPEVRTFWRRKLASLMHGARPVYCETSHFLAKAGLVENLDLLGVDAEVHLIHLQRDTFDTAWSLANRFDFFNLGFTWLFYLDPRYDRNLVPSEQFSRFGMLGMALWYVHEMNARGEYYRRRLADRPGVHLHRVRLESLGRDGDEAPALLHALQPEFRRETVDYPAHANRTERWMLGEKERDQLRRLVEGAQVDMEDIVGYAVERELLGALHRAT